MATSSDGSVIDQAADPVPLSALLAETPEAPGSDVRASSGTNGASATNGTAALSEESFAEVAAEIEAEEVIDDEEIEAAPESEDYEELDGAEFEDVPESSPWSASDGEAEGQVEGEAAADTTDVGLSASGEISPESSGEDGVADDASEIDDADVEDADVEDDDDDEIELLVDDDDFE